MNGAVDIIKHSLPTPPVIGEIRQFCGFAVVSKSTNDPNWYWLPDASTFVDTNNAEELTVNTNTVVYLGAKNAEGCWSVVSQAINVTNTIPDVTILSHSGNACNGESMELTAQGADYYIWHDDAGNVMYESADFTTPPLYSTTTFMVTGYTEQGCFKDVSTTINGQSVENHVPNEPYLTKAGEQYQLHINNTNNSPTGMTYYWQDLPGGTSTSNGLESTAASGPGIFYVRGLNSQGCWGPSTSVEVPDLTSPVYETTVTNSSVNYVKTFIFQNPGLSLSGADSLSADDVALTTQYLDGLGRPMQTMMALAGQFANSSITPQAPIRARCKVIRLPLKKRFIRVPLKLDTRIFHSAIPILKTHRSM
jgi:hypothetical protein